MRLITPRFALALMVLCLLVAAALRLPDLATTPPGLHYDEAANAILATEIGLGGERPVFISSYTGKEALFFYLAGGLMRLAGSSVFTLRLTAAFVGLLTVAVTYWLGWELLRDRRLALLAAALLATSFWHLVFSRYGFRAVSQPLLQALTVAALLRGLRRDQWHWLVASGVFLGLAGYTYLAVRLFPVLLLLATLPLLLNRQQGYRRGRQMALVAAIALVIFTPLLIYFLTHPAAFWVRIGQVAPETAGPRLSLAESFLRSLAMLFLQGDPYWRFNLPQRPLFDWFWGGLLLVGWLVCLFRWRSRRHDWQRSALLLLILTPFIMILPTALAVNEIVPSNLRAIGLIPFVFYLPAIGLVTLLADLDRRFGWPQTAPAVVATVALVLLAGSLFTERAYFRTWATEPALYFESDADLAAAAEFLDEIETQGKTIYVAALHYQHPTLAFLSRYYGEIKWLPRSQALVFHPDNPSVYVYPHSSPAPRWALPYLGTAARLDSVSGPRRQPAFAAYELAEPPPLAIPNQVDANFGNAITLLGYEVEEGAAGTTMPVTLYWRVDGRAPAGDFTAFVHLEDAWRYRWSQVESFAYPSEQWQPGETIIQRVDVPVPAGTPPGAYRLRVGLFAGSSGERLPRLDEGGRYAGNTFMIENASVVASPLPADHPRPAHVVEEWVQSGLFLLGYERGRLEVSTGENLDLALWWRVTEPLPELTTRLELLRANNTGRILADTQPVHGTYPFTDWTTPQFLIDRVTPRIPESIPAGDYRLHLRLLGGDDNTVYTADLGPLRVTPTERRYTPPPLDEPLAATFGNEIELLGYSLEPGDAAGRYSLTLAWQALSEPATDYTVFVHVLQADGTCSPCVWQQDVMPQQNQYPTSRWLAGEVVVDSYEIEAPAGTAPGEYVIEVGLYIAETGRRLQVTMPGRADSDVVLLRPLRIE